MNEWIDLFLYMVLNILAFIVAPIGARRTAQLFIEDRNRQWAQENPDFGRKVVRRSLLAVAPALLGGAGILAMLGFQLDLLPSSWLLKFETARWEMLRTIHAFSAVPAAVCVGFNAMILMRRIERTVPVAERRSATLKRRTLDDFVPAWLQHTTTTVTTFALVAAIAVGLNAEVAHAYWTGLGTVVLMWVIVRLVIRGTVQHRPTFMDRIFGTDYRRTNVRIVFGLQFLVMLACALVLLEQVPGFERVEWERIAHLSLVLWVAVSLLFTIRRWRVPPATPTGFPGMFRSARSAATDSSW